MSRQITTRPDEFEYDTALLPHQGITDDALNTMDVIADAAEAARKLLAKLDHMQRMLEAHADPYTVKQQFAVDVEINANDVRRHTAILLGVEGVLS